MAPTSSCIWRPAPQRPPDIIAGALVGARDDAYWPAAHAARPARHDPRPDRGMVADARHAHAVPARRLACRSAEALAERFAAHPMVAEVLLSRPAGFAGHTVAKAQMTGGFSGMLSVRIKGGERAAIATAARVALWKRATSLGRRKPDRAPRQHRRARERLPDRPVAPCRSASRTRMICLTTSTRPRVAPTTREAEAPLPPRKSSILPCHRLRAGPEPSARSMNFIQRRPRRGGVSKGPQTECCLPTSR